MGRLAIPLLLLVLLVGAAVVSDRPQPSADLTFINRGDVNTLDIQRMSWMQDLRVARLLFEGLTRTDIMSWEFEQVPGVGRVLDDLRRPTHLHVHHPRRRAVVQRRSRYRARLRLLLAAGAAPRHRQQVRQLPLVHRGRACVLRLARRRARRSREADRRRLRKRGAGHRTLGPDNRAVRPARRRRRARRSHARRHARATCPVLPRDLRFPRPPSPPPGTPEPVRTPRPDDRAHQLTAGLDPRRRADIERPVPARSLAIQARHAPREERAALASRPDQHRLDRHPQRGRAQRDCPRVRVRRHRLGLRRDRAVPRRHLREEARVLRRAPGAVRISARARGSTRSRSTAGSRPTSARASTRSPRSAPTGTTSTARRRSQTGVTTRSPTRASGARSR